MPLHRDGLIVYALIIIWIVSSKFAINSSRTRPPSASRGTVSQRDFSSQAMPTQRATFSTASHPLPPNWTASPSSRRKASDISWERWSFEPESHSACRFPQLWSQLQSRTTFIPELASCSMIFVMLQWGQLSLLANQSKLYVNLTKYQQCLTWSSRYTFGILRHSRGNVCLWRFWSSTHSNTNTCARRSSKWRMKFCLLWALKFIGCSTSRIGISVDFSKHSTDIQSAAGFAKPHGLI